jgi:hypothetical protein
VIDDYTGAMKVQVKPLRQRGSRLSDQQIASLAPVEGVITIYGLGTTIQLSLYNGTAKQEPLIPDLYDARLVSMHGNKMLFAGIERTADKDAAQYFQEWAVVIVAI